MAQGGGGGHALNLRVLHDQLGHERAVEGDVDVLVDGIDRVVLGAALLATFEIRQSLLLFPIGRDPPDVDNAGTRVQSEEIDP